MLRIIVSVLAAFVGFSFGHSIPKWMESKTKSCLGAQSSPLSEPAHRAHKHSFRRKSLRKLRFGGSQKAGKVAREENELRHHYDDDVQIKTPLHEDKKCVKNVPLSAHDRLQKETRKLKFGSQRLQKDKPKLDCSVQVLDSDTNVPPSPAKLHSDSRFPESDAYVNSKHGCHQPKATSTDRKASRSELCQIDSSQLNATCASPQVRQENVASLNDSESDARKSLSLHSSSGSPTKEKNQMKQWKMKLTSLRNKALASEKVWYEKFDNESCGRKLKVALTAGPTRAIKKPAQGKENESPCQIKNKKKDFFWSRSSSKVGLLVEGPKSAFER
ncbi:hypothetical protein L7F22_026176 [Adiantum nelumboides]|nr:hypothetical protein [Adiantum nelumboides]